jgi:hypothetical protein
VSVYIAQDEEELESDPRMVEGLTYIGRLSTSAHSEEEERFLPESGERKGGQ